MSKILHVVTQQSGDGLKIEIFTNKDKAEKYREMLNRDYENGYANSNSWTTEVRLNEKLDLVKIDKTLNEIEIEKEDKEDELYL